LEHKTSAKCGTNNVGKRSDVVLLARFLLPIRMMTETNEGTDTLGDENHRNVVDS